MRRNQGRGAEVPDARRLGGRKYAAALTTLFAASISVAIPLEAQAAFTGKIVFERSEFDFGRACSNPCIDGLYVMNADGTDERRLTSNGSDQDAAWSPDGKKIAFSRAGSSGTPDIFVMNADGTGAIQLTDRGFSNTPARDFADDYNPTWSPDGTRIAFHRVNLNTFPKPTDLQHPDIFVVNADGTGMNNLTKTRDQAERYPSWSPLGARIAFAKIVNPAGDVRSDVYAINADGKNLAQLTEGALAQPGPRSFFQPSWSPDGTRIAFVDDFSDLWTMDANGNNETRVSVLDHVWPEWSPDGTAITFATNRDSNFEIYITPASGSPQVRVTTNTWFDTGPDWTAGAAAAPGDTVPPDTTITAGPSGEMPNLVVTFQFRSSEPGSTFQCSLDNALFAPCTSPQTYTIGAEEVNHVFRVRAVDAAGNIDPSPAERTWKRRACTITGTELPDRITGTAANDVICTLGGDDEVRAGGGSDTVIAGDGADKVQGEGGNDHLWGGPGGDELDGGDGDDFLMGEETFNRLNGGNGIDECYPGVNGADVVNCERVI